jgi:glycosyltransferase involved in cell wall biosynthesis
MRCPTLNELPPPPSGMMGWPWTKASSLTPDLMPDGSEWPRVSIVTPNYNYGHFIEETIRSILLQGYPNLEYVIIDGASTDSSVDIIKKYKHWLKYWVSEKDNGQSSAINKGIEKCTGDIFNWINSDDRLTEGSLQKIAIEIQAASAFAGVVGNFDERSFGSSPIENQNLSAVSMVIGSTKPVFHQPGLWLRLDKLQSVGILEESLRYCFDWDLTVRYLSKFPDLQYSSAIVCDFRLHDASKTVCDQESFDQEREEVRRRLLVNKDYQNLHPFIKVYFRRQNWYKLLNEILTSLHTSKFQKSFRIISSACGDPTVRWSRLTLGAIRKILLG